MGKNCVTNLKQRENKIGIFFTNIASNYTHLCIPPIIKQLRVGPCGEGHVIVSCQPQVVIGASWRWRVKKLLDMGGTGCYVPVGKQRE